MDKDFNNMNMPPFMDINMMQRSDLAHLIWEIYIVILCLILWPNMNRRIATIDICVCKWIIRLSVKSMKKCVEMAVKKVKEELNNVTLLLYFINSFI